MTPGKQQPGAEAGVIIVCPAEKVGIFSRFDGIGKTSTTQRHGIEPVGKTTAGPDGARCRSPLQESQNVKPDPQKH